MVGKVTRTGSRVVTHNSSLSLEQNLGREQPHGFNRINFKLRLRINKSFFPGYFYSPNDGGLNSAITAIPVVP